MRSFVLSLLGALVFTTAAQAASFSHSALGVRGTRGYTAPLGSASISQMTDNTPVSGFGVACYTGTTTNDTSWWRRFYFSEHGSPGSASVESVTISVETGPITPININLYTIPHSEAIDTISLEDLTLIGTGAGSSDGTDLQTLTVPVSATVADASATDLVVEYHIDGAADGIFAGGANEAEETHTSFISSEACAFPEPTPAADIGFPDMHTIMIVNLGATGPGAPSLSTSFAPSEVVVDATSTLTVSLRNQSQPGVATLSSDLVDSFPAGLVVATVPNAATTCGGTAVVSANAGESNFSLSSGSIIPASGNCSMVVDVMSGAGGTYVNSFAAGALVTDVGSNVLAASANLVVIPAGGKNGIISSGLLNHAVVDDDTTGTSLNMVTSELDDTGPISGDWDYNFWNSVGAADLQFWVVGTYNAQFAVDSSGFALLFHPGDAVGPNQMFGGNDGSVSPVAAWKAGADGYAGVKFDCNGRLKFAVAGTVCYGYVHLTTTGPSGFPATILNTAFDGDGNAIAIVADVIFADGFDVKQ